MVVGKTKLQCAVIGSENNKHDVPMKNRRQFYFYVSLMCDSVPSAALQIADKKQKSRRDGEKC